MAACARLHIPISCPGLPPNEQPSTRLWEEAGCNMTTPAHSQGCLGLLKVSQSVKNEAASSRMGSCLGQLVLPSWVS